MSQHHPPTDHRWDIGLLWSLGVGLLTYMSFATYKGEAVDTAACLGVLIIIVTAVKERWLARSLDRMGQHLAEAQPISPEGTPAGTKEDPVHIAGAGQQEPPVVTTPAKGGRK